MDAPLAMDWGWAEHDENALAQLEARIRQARQDLQLFLVTDLVRGIDSRLPGIHDRQPREFAMHVLTSRH